MIFAKTLFVDEENCRQTEARYLNYWQLWHHNWDDNDILKIRESLQLANKKVLEVGCGDGRVAFGLQNFCRQLIAIDRDSRFIAIAEKRDDEHSNLQFLTMDAEKLDFADDSFDIVLMPWVLQMVSDPFRALSEASRVLKKGGQMYIIALRSDADYDKIIGQFVANFPTIDIENAYEKPMRSCFSDATIEMTQQTFFYFFETPKIALDAFSFAIEYWYDNAVSDEDAAKLSKILQHYVFANRVRIAFPANLYKIST